MRMDIALQPLAKLSPGLLEVEIRLQSHPEAFADAEIASQAQGGISGDSPLAEDNFVDPPRWYTDVAGNAILADAQGTKELLQEDFAGVDVPQTLGHDLLRQ